MTATPISLVSDPKRVKAIRDAIGASRRVFPTAEAAATALAEAATKTNNFDGVPVSIHGLVTDKEGNSSIDPTAYFGMNAVLGIVAAQTAVAGSDKKINAIKGVVLFPVPMLDTLLESDTARNWLAKIVEKEGAHVLYRPYRAAESVEAFEAAIDEAPKTVDEFVTQADRSGDLDTSAFDAVWKEFRTAFAKSHKEANRATPQKVPFIRCLRSKAAALREYPKQEAANLFVGVAGLLIEAIEASGEDPAEIKAWLAGRNELDLPTPGAAGIGDLGDLGF
jgi:hypothetical protein